MRDLSDVTLYSIDSKNMALAGRALTLSMLQYNFRDAILFSHEHVPGPFRCVPIPNARSVKEFESLSLKVIPQHIGTPYALLVQWDGYVVDGRFWRDEFRNYDYIGARWPHFKDGFDVGNGGFCLQSRKLLDAFGDTRVQVDPQLPVDVLICRKLRGFLEQEHGVHFAPASVADRFSYENIAPTQPTFGFHGCGNLWRHCSDDEMMGLLHQMDDYVLRTQHFSILALTYLSQRKFAMFEAAFRRMREVMTAAEAENVFTRAGNQQLARQAARLGEELIKLQSGDLPLRADRS